MSQKYYTTSWWKTQRDLNKAIRLDRPVKPKREEDVTRAFEDISYRYVKYSLIYANLQRCYDSMIHPQKRTLIAKCLEGVAGRVLELKEDLIRLEMNEYINTTNICFDMKISPVEIELKLPLSYLAERVPMIRQRQALITMMQKSDGKTEAVVEDEDYISIPEAILMIQKNQRMIFAKKKMKKAKVSRSRKKKVDDIDIELTDRILEGIAHFQALWRGHQARKRISKIRHEAAIFLGMLDPNPQKDLNMQENAITLNIIKRANEQTNKFVEDQIITAEKMADREQEDTVDAVIDEMRLPLRQWALELKNITGQFPDYPPEEEGGSNRLYDLEKTMQELEFDMDDLEEELGKDKKGKSKPKGGKDDKKKKKPMKKVKEMIFEETQSKFIEPTLVEEVNEFASVWLHRDESDNPHQNHDRNIMLEKLRKDLEESVREQLDELMRQELDRLRQGIEQIPPPKKKPDKKKNKNKGKKKKKGLKDLTPNVPMEDLFKLLVTQGIIVPVQERPLSRYIGEMNYLCKGDHADLEVYPDLGDIRKMIFENAIFPMSSAKLRETAPFLKSLLLCGPTGSGKSDLLHSICFELGATMFDLSPDNLIDKFPDKAGQRMLMHLVMKVGKEWEPSIICIRESDLMFSKKLTPDQKRNKPNRMKNDIMKALKVLTPEDRIMFIGTTSFPFNSAPGPMMKMFNRLISIYPPSHASRLKIWQTLIQDFEGVINQHFDLSSLSQVSRGYTSGAIYQTISEVLTVKRVARQVKMPITPKEFLERINLQEPVYREELEAFKEWYKKWPLEKQRQVLRDKMAKGQNVIGFL